MDNKTLKNGDKFEDIYFCIETNDDVKKDGNAYKKLILRDKTGKRQIGRIWEINKNIDSYKQGDFINISGIAKTYKSELQLNIEKLDVVDKNNIPIEEFCPKTEKNIDEMYECLLGYVDKVENYVLKQLLNSFFREDDFILNEFKKHSAAKKVHHNFIGGLLEHTINVVKISYMIYEQYSNIINKDLLITAALLHDIGKLYELSDFPENKYTNYGNFAKHIYIGAELIHDKFKNIDSPNPDIEYQLKHCILSHHNKLEFGSPVGPSLIEALVVSKADDIDAKIEQYKNVINQCGENWSDNQRLLDNLSLRKTIL